MKKKHSLYLKKYLVKIIKNPLLLSVVINFSYLILILFFCDLKYEVSDDFVMASILSGAYGTEQNPQIIFTNVLIGYILIPFYKIFPQVSWYFVFHILVIIVSSIFVLFFLFEKLDKYLAVMLGTVFLLFFVSDALILVQFTKTAIFAVVSGSIVFIDALYERKSWIQVAFGGAMCLCGTMIRFSVIYIAGGFIILILLLETIRFLRNKNEKKRVKQFIDIVLCGAILIGCAYALKWVDWYTYNNDEPYGFFSAFNTARSHVVDSAEYGYYSYADQLQELGISENDYYMIKTWSFADNEVFTIDKLENVAEIIGEYKKAQEVSIETIFENLLEREITNYPVFLACVLLVVLFVVFDFKNLWLMLGNACIGLGLLFYFVFRERSLYRIEFSVLFCVFVYGCYLLTSKCNQNISGDEEKKKWKSNVCKGIVLLTFLWNLVLFIPDQSYKKVTSENRKSYIENVFYSSWNYDARKYRKVVNKEKPANLLLEEIEDHPDNFYFLDFNTTIQTLYYDWSPWESLPVRTYDNYLYLGGVMSNHPDVVQILENKGLSNPLKSLVEDNVYLVDSYNIEMKLTYLREHYYPDARAELYKDAGGYQIWKIYEE